MRFLNKTFILSLLIPTALLSLTACSKEEPGYDPVSNIGAYSNLCISFYDFTTDGVDKPLRIINLEDNSEIEYEEEVAENSNGEEVRRIRFNAALPDARNMFYADPYISYGSADTRFCAGDQSVDLRCIFERIVPELGDEDDLFFGGFSTHMMLIKCLTQVIDVERLKKSRWDPNLDLLLYDDGFVLQFEYVNE